MARTSWPPVAEADQADIGLLVGRITGAKVKVAADDYQNRQYSPGLGRFGRRDPLLGGDPLFNAYGFPTVNPVASKDVMGTKVFYDKDEKSKTIVIYDLLRYTSDQLKADELSDAAKKHKEIMETAFNKANEGKGYEYTDEKGCKWKLKLVVTISTASTYDFEQFRDKIAALKNDEAARLKEALDYQQRAGTPWSASYDPIYTPVNVTLVPGKIDVSQVPYAQLGWVDKMGALSNILLHELLGHQAGNRDEYLKPGESNTRQRDEIYEMETRKQAQTPLGTKPVGIEPDAMMVSPSGLDVKGRFYPRNFKAMFEYLDNITNKKFDASVGAIPLSPDAPYFSGSWTEMDTKSKEEAKKLGKAVYEKVKEVIAQEGSSAGKEK